MRPVIAPIGASSSLTNWRKRIGEAGAEQPFAQATRQGVAQFGRAGDCARDHAAFEFRQQPQTADFDFGQFGHRKDSWWRFQRNEVKTG